MKWPLSILLVLTGLFAGSISAPSQTPKKAAEKISDLKIRIAPNKDTYFVGEKVVTATEFTNISDKILCVPQPAQGQAVAGSGYVVTEGALLDTTGRVRGDRDQFMEQFCGGVTWPREKLLSEIDRFWIKLAPNQVYVTKSVKAIVKLNEPGQWQITATYHPPECSFNIKECTEYIKSTVQSGGCMLPEAVVRAEAVTVNVVPAPE